MNETVECWNCEEPLEPSEETLVDQDHDPGREYHLCEDCRFMLEEPAIVAALVLDVSPDSLDVFHGSHAYTFQGGGNEALIVEESDLESVFRDAVETFVYDCLEIPENLIYYFDVDRFADDARSDGYATWLGYEYEYEIRLWGSDYYAFTQG